MLLEALDVFAGVAVLAAMNKRIYEIISAGRSKLLRVYLVPAERRPNVFS